MAPVSRNAPCPCGSGKKYKLCCLPKEEATAEAAPPPGSPDQYRAALTELHGRLLQYVRSPAARAELPRALHEYFPEECGGPPPSFEATPQDFFDWLLADRRRREGGTLLDQFLKEKGHRLLPRESEVGRLLAASRMDLFEVLAAQKGELVTLRRLLNGGEEVRLFEKAPAREVIEGALLAARLVEPPGAVLLAQGRILIPPGERDGLLDFLERERAKRWGGSTWAEFLKGDGVLFRFYVMRRLIELRRRAEAEPPPEPKVLATARYDMLELVVAREMIRAMPGMQDKGEEGERTFLSWNLGGAERPADLVLTPRELHITCFSRDTLRLARKRLEETLGNLVSHRADEFVAP